MAFEWDDERKEYVEVIKIANPEDLGISPGGGGEAESVEWNNVMNKPQTYPPSEHDHDDRYNTKEDVQGIIDFVIEQMEQEQGKVRTFSDDEPDFLKNKVDAATVGVRGSEVYVKSVDGLNIGVTDINNALEGVEGNVQTQINDLISMLEGISGGMKFKDIAETRAEIDEWGNKENGDVVVVLTDETRNDGRSMYVYSEDLGMWRYIGTFTFTTNFTGLSDTPSTYENGKYLKSTNSGIVYGDVDYQDIANKPQSTITQIDDAVTKRHEHNNADSLAKLGVNERGELTINGVVYAPKIELEPKEILSTYLSNTITVAEGNFIPFNSVKPLSNIPYDTDTGIFTLTPGKSYRVTVTLVGDISKYITIYFASQSTKVRSHPGALIYGATSGITARGSSGVLDTTFTISESSDGKYGIMLGDAGTGFTAVELFGNRGTLIIQEI